LRLQTGADFKVAGDFTVAPFASLSIGQFSDFSQSCSAAPGSMASALALAFCVTEHQSISNTALHEWLTLGVEGTYGL
jgi:hypothetical protein